MKIMINHSTNNISKSTNAERDMAKREKLKKVVAVAVAYYLEQEKKCASSNTCGSNVRWVSTRQAMQMRERIMVQQRGRIASTRTLFRRNDTAIAS